MAANPLDGIRAHLARSLDWEEAHAGFDKTVANIPDHLRGAQPAGFAHSAWQLLEHLRIAQKDLLDFAVNAKYVHSLRWPADYWPSDPSPTSASAWNESIADFKADLEKLKQFVREPKVDLLALVPTGKDEQTVLRTILLVIDHNAYHMGQLVAVRRALGIW